MLGFLLGFLKTPTPNSDRQCWVFLLDFCWVFRKSCLVLVGVLACLLDFCWVFVSFVGFLLGFWLICWIFVGTRSVFNFILEGIFVYFKYENILSRVNLNAKDAFLEQKTPLRSVFPTKIQQNAKNPTEIQQSAKTQQKTQLKSNKKTKQLGF